MFLNYRLPLVTSFKQSKVNIITFLIIIIKNNLLSFKIRKCAEAEPELAVQLDVFDEQRESDDAQSMQGPHGVDLNSPLDVFYAILRQVNF